jgi:hypothetical protein
MEGASFRKAAAKEYGEIFLIPRPALSFGFPAPKRMDQIDFLDAKPMRQTSMTIAKTSTGP